MNRQSAFPESTIRYASTRAAPNFRRLRRRRTPSPTRAAPNNDRDDGSGTPCAGSISETWFSANPARSLVMLMVTDAMLAPLRSEKPKNGASLQLGMQAPPIPDSVREESRLLALSKISTVAVNAPPELA